MTRQTGSTDVKSPRGITLIGTLCVGAVLGVLGLTHVVVPILTATTMIMLLIAILYLTTEQPLRLALTVGLILFAVTFLVLYLGTEFRFGTVVLGGSNSHTLFASEMAGQPLRELIPPPDNDYYFVFLTLLYAMGPLGYFIPILVNLVAFCFFVVVTYRLADLIFGKIHARNTAAIIVAFPTVYLHLYATRPDFLSVALVVGIVYILTLIMSQPHPRYLVYLVVLMFGILLLRIQLAALLLLIAVSTVTLRPFWEGATRERIIWTGVSSTFASLLFVAVLFATDIWGIRSQGFTSALSRILSFQAVNEGGLSTIVYGAPVPVRLLLGFIPLIITPFPPWESFTASPSMTFFTVGGLVFFALLPFALAGLVETIRRTTENALMLTMYTLGITATLALVYGGFALKFRLLLLPPLAMFASVGLAVRKWYRYFVAFCYASYPAVVVVYLSLTGAI